MIFAVASFIICGLLLVAAPDSPNSVRVSEANEAQVSPDDEVLRYGNLSAAGQDVFDQGLRTDGYTRVYQSPPDFDYPDDTVVTTYVEKNGTIYTIGTGISGCKTCGFVDALGIGAGLAGIVLLLRGVSRSVDGDAEAPEG